jgi:hypothetical protein
VSPAAVGAAPAKPKSMFDTGWQEFKGLVAGKPGEPFVPAGSPPPDPTKQAQTEPPKAVYAGPPAYRWFGWGTTTPGANPHAPNGQSPQASANWYARTGATPGAFPTTTAQPVTPAAYEPPQYAGPVRPYPGPREPEPFFAPPPASMPVNTPMFPPPTGVWTEPPIAQSPPSVELPPPNGLFPPPAPPGVTPVPFTTGGDVQWMPVGARQELRPEVVPTSAWSPAGPSLEEQVRAACKGTAEVLAVQPTGPGRLTVRLNARTESHARVAADEVARLPALRGYEVAFEAKFGDR